MHHSQDLEWSPSPRGSHAVPKASHELANVFGQQIRLSADFETRERGAAVPRRLFASGRAETAFAREDEDDEDAVRSSSVI